MELILIRHSMTAENLEHRYIGSRTDPSLCPAGVALAKKQARQLYQLPEQVFVSPMRRCQETAAILFPDVPQKILPDLKECNFGRFEGKNYQELSGDAMYQAWIDSGGLLPFPDGESRAAFVERSCHAVEEAVRQCCAETAAIVAHGGTLMAVLSEKEESHKPYFDWRIPHCVPFFCQVVGRTPLRLRYHGGEKDATANGGN